MADLAQLEQFIAKGLKEGTGRRPLPRSVPQLPLKSDRAQDLMNV
jgi:hypothetical protein